MTTYRQTLHGIACCCAVQRRVARCNMCWRCNMCLLPCLFVCLFFLFVVSKCVVCFAACVMYCIIYQNLPFFLGVECKKMTEGKSLGALKMSLMQKELASFSEQVPLIVYCVMRGMRVVDVCLAWSHLSSLVSCVLLCVYICVCCVCMCLCNMREQTTSGGS